MGSDTSSSVRPALRAASIGIGVVALVLGGCRGSSSRSTAPSSERSHEHPTAIGTDIDQLRAALGQPEAPRRGFARAHGDGIALWLVPADTSGERPAELELLRLSGPASGCRAAPRAETSLVLFEGPHSRALALTEPPVVVGFDAERSCLVSWPLPAFRVPPEQASPRGTLRASIDLVAEHPKGTVQRAELEVELDERREGRERVRLSLSEPHAELEVLDARGKELARWRDDEGPCAQEDVTLLVHGATASTTLTLQHDCVGDGGSDHHGGQATRTQHLAWRPNAPAGQRIERRQLSLLADGRSWTLGMEQASKTELEQSIWPVAGGRLVAERSREHEELANAVCEDGEDPDDEWGEPNDEWGEPEEGDDPACCTQREETTILRRRWSFEPHDSEPVELHAEQATSQRFDNGDCAEHLNALLAAGIVRLHDDRLWRPDDGIRRNELDADEPCANELLGMPPMRLPTAEELLELHAAGLVGRGWYWVAERPQDVDDPPMPQAIEVPGGKRGESEGAECSSICVADRP